MGKEFERGGFQGGRGGRGARGGRGGGEGGQQTASVGLRKLVGRLQRNSGGVA